MSRIKEIRFGNWVRWIEQSLVRRRTDSSFGELDVKVMLAKPSSLSIARRSGRSTSQHADGARDQQDYDAE